MGAYVDVSDRTLLSMKGADAQDLLQRISTNDLSRLQTGDTVETILTNEKGRIIDILLVHKREGNEFLLAGRSKAPKEISGWLNKFIIMEDISVTNVTDNHAQFQLFDITYQEVLSCSSTIDCLILQSKNRKNELVRLVVEVAKKDHLSKIIHANGKDQKSDQEYESFRVDRGIPDWPNEICDRYNPLELGLEHCVSFTKGCYVGQEVIARLDTYKKIQKGIMRLGLESNPPSLPSSLFLGDKEVGVITSCASRTESNSGSAAIGFLDKGTDTSKREIYYLSDTSRKSAYLLHEE